MPDGRLGTVEGCFAEIVWKNAPLTTRELVELCQKELNWKRTTTYTVLKKFCLRGIFDLQDRMVTVLVPKEEFFAIQSQRFVEDAFSGSLPAFIAAFTKRKQPSAKELAQIRELLDSFGEG